MSRRTDNNNLFEISVEMFPMNRRLIHEIEDRSDAKSHMLPGSGCANLNKALRIHKGVLLLCRDGVCDCMCIQLCACIPHIIRIMGRSDCASKIPDSAFAPAYLLFSSQPKDELFYSQLQGRQPLPCARATCPFGAA